MDHYGFFFETVLDPMRVFRREIRSTKLQMADDFYEGDSARCVSVNRT